jgi:hypothetical protein
MGDQTTLCPRYCLRRARGRGQTPVSWGRTYLREHSVRSPRTAKSEGGIKPPPGTRERFFFYPATWVKPNAYIALSDDSPPVKVTMMYSDPLNQIGDVHTVWDPY